MTGGFDGVGEGSSSRQEFITPMYALPAIKSVTPAAIAMCALLRLFFLLG